MISGLSKISLGLLILVGAPARALEVRVAFRSCFPGAGCGWSMQIGPNREAKLEVTPEAHLSRRFSLSQDQIADMKAMLAREDFFSLPGKVGDLVPDGALVDIQVIDGSKRHTVRLTQLPRELGPIWKTEAGPVGRAYRVCEGLRSLTGLTNVAHCPGVAESVGARNYEADDAPARMIKAVAPKYPIDALLKRIEGTVILEFVIDEKGKAGDIRVLASVPALDDAAKETVRQWQFEPARAGGKPIRTTATAPVKFCIEDGCTAPRGKPTDPK